MYENLRMQIPYMSVDENCPPRAFFFSSSSIIYIKWKKSGKPPKGKKKMQVNGNRRVDCDASFFLTS